MPKVRDIVVSERLFNDAAKQLVEAVADHPALNNENPLSKFAHMNGRTLLERYVEFVLEDPINVEGFIQSLEEEQEMEEDGGYLV